MSVMVAKRRIQRLGGSSLIVTLPKSWAKRYGLDVGDTVMVIDEGDHIKIFPPDARTAQLSDHVRLKPINGTMEIGISSIIGCMYSKGYKRFSILHQHMTTEEVLKMLEEAKAHPKVKSVSLHYDEIEISLEGSDEDNMLRQIRTYTIKIQEMLDALETLHGSRDDKAFNAMLQEAVMAAATISRQSRKHGISVCSVEGVDPTISGNLIAVANIIKMIYEESKASGRLPAEIVRKLKTATLELFGGISGKSGKRTALAMKILEELERDARSMEGRLGGLVLALAASLKSIGSLTLCEHIRKEGSA